MLDISFSLKYFKKNYNYLLYLKKDLLSNNYNDSFIILFLTNLNSLFNLIFKTDNEFKYRDYHHIDSYTASNIENNRDLVLQQELDFLKVKYNVKEDLDTKQFQINFNWLRNPENNINLFGYSWNLDKNSNQSNNNEIISDTNIKFIKKYKPIYNSGINSKIFLSSSDFLKYISLKNQKNLVINKVQNTAIREDLLFQYGLLKKPKKDTITDNLNNNGVLQNNLNIDLTSHIDVDYLKFIIFNKDTHINYEKLLKKQKKKIEFIPIELKNTSAFIDFSEVLQRIDDPFFINEYGKRVKLVNEVKNNIDILNNKFNYTLLTDYESSEEASETINDNFSVNLSVDELNITNNIKNDNILQNKLYYNFIFLKYIKYINFISHYFLYLFNNGIHLIKLPTAQKKFSILRSSVNYKKAQQNFRYIIKKKLIYFSIKLKELYIMYFSWFFFNYIFLMFLKNISISLEYNNISNQTTIYNNIPQLLNNFFFYKQIYKFNE